MQRPSNVSEPRGVVLHPSAHIADLCRSLLHVVELLGLLHDALGPHVGSDGEDDHHDREEGGHLKLVLEGGQGHLSDVDHEHGNGLADVLEHGVQDGQEVHGAPALDGERGKNAQSDAAPAREEAVLPGPAVDEGEHQDGDEPGTLELHNLHIDRLVLEVLHELVGENRAEARDRDLHQDVDDAHDGDAVAAAAAAAAADHVDAHGEHDEQEDVPLQGRLLRALDAPHHQRRDDKLRLQQDLVGSASKAAHACHLQVVAQGIHEPDE
mmetsp:Transcript_16837/g.35156  ORF Transcript_16837/g.35156 Transcript_16837/m.35156 type:complete len:267 (+) Transcript_16837:72-872(+)